MAAQINTRQAPPEMNMDFQGYLKNSYSMLKGQLFILILGSLLAQVLVIISFGLLAGPVLGGYQLMVIHYLRDGNRPEFNDLFSGFQRFGSLFPLFFLSLLIVIGFAFLIIPGILFSTWWIYVLPLMADKNIPFRTAMRTSFNKVTEKGFFIHLVFLLMISVIPILIIQLITAIIPPLSVLQILLLPLQTACVAGLYLDVFHGLPPESIAERLATPSSSASPPPSNEKEDKTRQLPGA